VGLKVTAGEGFCEDLSCQKARVGEGGELECALVDVTGTGKTVPSCREKQFEKKLCKRCVKDNKHNSLHLGQKYARIFVLGHYLFLIAHSHCSLLGTDNVRGQISEHIFAPNGGYCLYIPQFSKLRALRKRFEGYQIQ